MYTHLVIIQIILAVANVIVVSYKITHKNKIIIKLNNLLMKLLMNRLKIKLMPKKLKKKYMKRLKNINKR